jgi:hypothetical protein
MTRTILYFSASTGSYLRQQGTFWWPDFLRKRQQHSGLLFTYADKKITEDALVQLKSDLKNHPTTKPGRALFTKELT